MNSSSISISAIGSVSPLGNSPEEIWENYLNPTHFINEIKIGCKLELAAAIPEKTKREIEQLKIADVKYKNLDLSVLYAIYVSRKAFKEAKWDTDNNFGINIGSSRGATSLFEKYHKEFLDKNKAATLSSSTTTLGNISSWVAHDLQSSGPEISHSITCSTALHALINGVAWLRSGMCDKFMVGGSEASLTPFTIAQMKAMKIYATHKDEFPCKALDFNKERNTMVLGEGASVACLENGVSKNALALIEGIGYATEPLEHNISISTHADCFQKSMRMAIKDISEKDVDVIVMHSPGTTKGDIAEFNAIKKVFKYDLPALTTNKWKIGHTFGASGMLSVEMAVLMLMHQQFIETPTMEVSVKPKKIKKVLVNAVGFGGNAVSVLLSSTI